jgi:hypothetical protein
MISRYRTMPMSEQQTLATVEERMVAPATLYQFLLEAARDPSIDPAKLRALMELQERAEARNAEREYIVAMNRLQPHLPRIIKHGRVDMGGKGVIPFARFEDIMEAVGPLLSAEGFTPTFGSKATDKGVLVVCTLKHAAGHSETSEMALPPDPGPGRNALQALGSSLQYARRYLLVGMLNLVTVNEDDDGAAISFVDELAINNINNMIAEIGMDSGSVAKFLRFMNVTKISEIRQSNYAKAMTLLQKKLQRTREGKP